MQNNNDNTFLSSSVTQLLFYAPILPIGRKLIKSLKVKNTGHFKFKHGHFHIPLPHLPYLRWHLHSRGLHGMMAWDTWGLCLLAVIHATLIPSWIPVPTSRFAGKSETWFSAPGASGSLCFCPIWVTRYTGHHLVNFEPLLTTQEIIWALLPDAPSRQEEGDSEGLCQPSYQDPCSPLSLCSTSRGMVATSYSKRWPWFSDS